MVFFLGAPQRARMALRAISFRRSGVSTFKRAVVIISAWAVFSAFVFPFHRFRPMD